MVRCFVEQFTDVELLAFNSARTLLQLSFSSCPEVSLSMKEKYLEWTLTTSGIKKARKLYKRLELCFL